MTKRIGEVYLVGSGPGDPGLITVNGFSLIKAADCIVYDQLAPRELLKSARPECELIFVGKEGGGASFPQKAINELLVKKARAGKRVVRLKGGDPFVFGRGGEEALFLKRHRIPFGVVPGISSAVAVPAYAGIPLTHRKLTSVLSIVTGHEAGDKAGSSIDFSSLARGGGTLVFLMGVGRLAKISGKLVSGGLAPGTPCALIGRGTTPNQRVVVGRLDNIPKLAAKEGMKPPCVLVIGKVVGMRKLLNWFETRPLFGRKIVVTRTREQASRLSAALWKNGAEAIEFPTIKIKNPPSQRPLDKAIERMGEFDWVIFTSANGVRKFLERLREKGKDLRALGNTKVCAIGDVTGEALISAGICPDYIPREYVAEGVVKGLRKFAEKGESFLIPRAREARDVLPEELRRLGGRVHVVDAYKTVRPGQFSGSILDDLRAGEIDMVTFMSSSTVRNFVSIFEGKFAGAKPAFKVASIGPITSAALRRLGYPVHVQAAAYTTDGLVRAIVKYYKKSGQACANR
ncbi:MAG: uroporphyrinogen-III C-methyltransferase [Candidatus Eisenbacteria bacterium]|nr:uroporphyrinogen-III C-methyltransferase [Candidatus Eisenbacteria bacterium]